MVILKRLKGSTLMETMIATVLIVIIFMMASLVMEATFSARMDNNMEPLSEKFHQLEYQYSKGGVAIPYFEEWDDWNIEMEKTDEQGTLMIALTAKNKTTQKEMKTLILQRNESN